MENDISVMKSIFSGIYRNNIWGSRESKSGIGSTKNYTHHIKETLIGVIQQYNIKTMLDTSCGDWNWMRDIIEKLPNYTGIDIVEDIVDTNNRNFGKENIKFINSDFLSYIKRQQDKSIDLILCRHTLEHLPTNYNLEFLDLCKTKSKYLMVTTHSLVQSNKDLIYPNTYRPVNMNLYPYNIIEKYLIDTRYDGPIHERLPEMNICIYYFGEIYENI
jgi:hypothetical protein